MHPPKPKVYKKKHEASFSSVGTLSHVKFSIMTVVWMRRRVLKGENLYEKLLEENATYL